MLEMTKFQLTAHVPLGGMAPPQILQVGGPAAELLLSVQMAGSPAARQHRHAMGDTM